MAGLIYHALLTRFNVRRGVEADPRVLSVEWLDARMKLFEEITVASVVAQTRRPDAWLVFFDEGTPQATRERFHRLTAVLPQLRAEYCNSFSAQVCIERIHHGLPAGIDWLVTTRLDNDDALHPRMIEQMRSLVRPGVREFINPSKGLIIAKGMLYRKHDYSSPFISLSEPLANCRSVFMDQHQRLGWHGRIQQFSMTDSWIQVVHGANLANQVRGVRVLPSRVSMQVLPQSLRASVRPVSAAELIMDNSIGLVRRYAGSIRRRVNRMLADRRAFKNC